MDSKQSKTIGELVVMSTYVRANGETWVKLNEKFHVKFILDVGTQEWTGDGVAEKVRLDERVEVVQL